ncbi:hypothetical protein EDB81DRAFT_919356 [Dactylonectria macrodidyma]|uniref:Uncharacterized protein n=1 Tax=Dactylonectria macrodidyma TaxID=307937 RepID=A0A9P9DB42_9HYPO|nr:hypothetical protein EDB81DRAFT_919356 [Dactylonectria macrodidyma]
MIASATATAMPAIPGLQSPLTVDDMDISNITYNELPRIHSDMGVSQEHVKMLETIIAQYNLREKLGIRLLHKHEDIPNGQINLETKLKTVAGKWIRPVSIDSLDLSEIHGVVFKFVLGENILVPYEFARGPSPVSMSDVVNNNCVKDILGYITTYGLVNVIALEFLEPVKDGQPVESAAKVEVGKYGAIVLPKSMVNATELIATSWPDISQPYNHDAEPDPGAHWAPVVVTKETHRLFVDQVEDENELLVNLALQGVFI